MKKKAKKKIFLLCFIDTLESFSLEIINRVRLIDFFFLIRILKYFKYLCVLALHGMSPPVQR